ncbi:unnamed protein product [Paramecium primaurelia]|uniref:Uncharacterized protein n=1 Tax=Paramecium primaurelia TaxID=5886 RepID=A0A8S1KZA5_PARPR|nr:unnamed protein product [Paramecium primaurelia]
MLYNLIPGKQSYLEKVQNVKQGDYLLFKDEPYKILKGQVKMSSHGICAYFKVEHAFSKQILEDKFHSNGYLEIPVIQFEEYNLVGINDDDFLSLLKSNGIQKIQGKKEYLLIDLYLFSFYFILYLLQIYLKKYPETAQYKKQLADLGGDIPLMFAQREVLYGRKNYMYLDATYFDRMWYYIMESLNNTKLFTSQDPDFNKMLVTNNFKDFYAQIQLSDLCEYLPGDIKIRAVSLCPTIMNQNMRHGLKAMLIYIQNLIETDVAINNFTYRAVPTQNELEGAFMISEVINVMNSYFYNDLIDVTTKLVDQQQIFNICYLVILFVVLLIIITEVKNKIYENSKIIIHFVYVIPSQTIFTDDTFERTLRTLINF